MGEFTFYDWKISILGLLRPDTCDNCEQETIDRIQFYQKLPERNNSHVVHRTFTLPAGKRRKSAAQLRRAPAMAGRSTSSGAIAFFRPNIRSSIRRLYYVGRG